jgi:DNA-binding Xre family transcriptional regulator
LAIKNKLLVLMAERKIRSLKSMSRQSGVKYGTLYKFAHQESSKLHCDTVERLCKSLDCGLDDLFYIDSKKEA